jgi:FkbM family methyltransferase
MDQWLLQGSSARQDRVLTDAINGLARGDTFIDVGANVGLYSILAARRVGPEGLVLAFEPSRREYRRLLHNVDVNEATNVLCYNLALSDASGIFSFVEAAGHTGLNHLAVAENAAGIVRTVPALPFSSLLEHVPAHRPVAIKIDVEGAELRALLGMQSLLAEERIKFVATEVTPKFLARFGDTKEKLYEFLHGFGFRSLHEASDWQYDDVFVRA